MSYKHEVIGNVVFLNPMNFVEIKEIFKPLCEAFGWEWRKDIPSVYPDGYDLKFMEGQPEKVEGVSFHTVRKLDPLTAEYVLTPLLNALNEIAKAGHITVRYYDYLYSSPESKINENYWYGDEGEVAFAKREEAISITKLSLHDTGLDLSNNAVEIGMHDMCRQKLKEVLGAHHVSPFLSVYQKFFYSLVFQFAMPCCSFGFHELKEGGWLIEPPHQFSDMHFKGGARISGHQAGLIVTYRALRHYKTSVSHAEVLETLNVGMHNVYEAIQAQPDAALITSLLG